MQDFTSPLDRIVSRAEEYLRLWAPGSTLLWGDYLDASGVLSLADEVQRLRNEVERLRMIVGAARRTS